MPSLRSQKWWISGERECAAGHPIRQAARGFVSAADITISFVMPGLTREARLRAYVPGIHVFFRSSPGDVDGREKPGHADQLCSARQCQDRAQCQRRAGCEPDRREAIPESRESIAKKVSMVLKFSFPDLT